MAIKQRLYDLLEGGNRTTAANDALIFF